MIDIRTLSVTQEMLNTISEIDEFKGAWRFLKKTSPERLKALKHYATIASIGSSNRIEGVKLTDQEVEELLAKVSIKSFKSRDEEEVVGYAEIMEELFTSWNSIPLSENYIKQMHGIMLKHCHKDPRHRGHYKKVPNNVEAFDHSGKSLGVIFETTSPFDTPREMEELVSWANEAFEEKKLHPLLVIGIFIVVFLAIHPFQDGNGRLSRIFTTFLLLKQGYEYVPYSSLESIVEDNKESYYLALRRTQTSFKKNESNWLPWLNFFLKTLLTQKRTLEKKVEGIEIIDKPMSELSITVMEMIKDHGRLTISQLLPLTNANRNTLKKHLIHLVKQGQLVQHGQGRGVWYSFPGS